MSNYDKYLASCEDDANANAKFQEQERARDRKLTPLGTPIPDWDEITDRVRYLSLDECESDEEYEAKMELLRGEAEAMVEGER